MKKLLGILIVVIIVIVIVALFGNGFGFGFGNGNGNGNGEGTIDNNTGTVSDTAEDKETEPAAEKVDKAIIAVTVLESDYIYQNKKTGLDDLIKELEKIEKDFVVEVTDNNASYKAYKSLINALEDNSIEYTQK